MMKGFAMNALKVPPSLFHSLFLVSELFNAPVPNPDPTILTQQAAQTVLPHHLMG